jgi:hypothetical protein
MATAARVHQQACRTHQESRQKKTVVPSHQSIPHHSNLTFRFNLMFTLALLQNSGVPSRRKVTCGGTALRRQFSADESRINYL